MLIYAGKGGARSHCLSLASVLQLTMWTTGLMLNLGKIKHRWEPKASWQLNKVHIWICFWPLRAEQDHNSGTLVANDTVNDLDSGGGRGHFYKAGFHTEKQCGPQHRVGPQCWHDSSKASICVLELPLRLYFMSSNTYLCPAASQHKHTILLDCLMTDYRLHLHIIYIL